MMPAGLKLGNKRTKALAIKIRLLFKFTKVNGFQDDCFEDEWIASFFDAINVVELIKYQF